MSMSLRWIWVTFVVLLFSQRGFAQITFNYLDVSTPATTTSSTLSIGGITSLQPYASANVINSDVTGSVFFTDGTTPISLLNTAIVAQGNIIVTDQNSGAPLGVHMVVPSNVNYPSSFAAAAFDTSVAWYFVAGQATGNSLLTPYATYLTYATFIVGMDLQGNGNFFVEPLRPVGSTIVYVTRLVSDNNGYIYVGGSFNGTADFDPTANTDFRSSSGFDGYISKFDILGNRIWTSILSATAVDLLAPMKIDVVTGNLLVLTTQNAGNNSDIGFYRLDSQTGAILNQFTISGSTTDFPLDLVSMPSGDWAMLVGSLSPTLDFDPTPGSQPNATFTRIGFLDSFLVKYNSLDQFRAAKSLGVALGQTFKGSISLNNCNEIVLVTPAVVNNSGQFWLHKYDQTTLLPTMTLNYSLPSGLGLLSAVLGQNSPFSGAQTLLLNFNTSNTIFMPQMAEMGIVDSQCP